MSWHKFDKNDRRTWPHEGKRVLFYAREHDNFYVGKGLNYNPIISAGKYEDNVIFIETPGTFETIDLDENISTHWTEIPEFEEDL